VPPTKKNPEEEARELIEADLARAGWIIQNRDEINTCRRGAESPSASSR